MLWTGLLLWACIVHNVEACFDDGEFYCAKLWYFWFVVFFIFVFILIGAIITTNLCTKKKRRVGARGQRAKARQKAAANKKRESKASILNKNEPTTKEAPSPQVSSKFPIPPVSNEGDLVASKRYFSNKGHSTSSKTATKDISDVENGRNVSGSLDEEMNTRESILTTRDLPASLVMEVEEVNDGKNDENDTPC